ncbi:MAG: hypothetical protein ACE5HF_11490, partial [Gemmatimonadota bacterium]
GAEGGSLLSPPDVLALVADSTDEWGRSLRTYRAIPMDRSSGHLRGLTRWFVRADTLWILWTDRTTRVGVALFAAADGFRGSARSLVGDVLEDGSEGTARAAAWKVNCATGLRVRERPEGRPRR